MTALLSSSWMAIFTAASFFLFLKKDRYCVRFPHISTHRNNVFPAAVACIYWDLSLWFRSLKWQRLSYLSQRLAHDPGVRLISDHIIKYLLEIRGTIHLISFVYVKGSIHVHSQVEKIIKVLIHFIQNRDSQCESPPASQSSLSDTGWNVCIQSRLCYFLSFMLSLTLGDTLQGYLRIWV